MSVGSRFFPGLEDWETSTSGSGSSRAGGRAARARGAAEETASKQIFGDGFAGKTTSAPGQGGGAASSSGETAQSGSLLAAAAAPEGALANLTAPPFAIGAYLPTTTGADFLSGGNSNEFANGRAGNDVLSGLNGKDFLWGDQGADSLYGGGGTDVLYGDAPAEGYDFGEFTIADRPGFTDQGNAVSRAGSGYAVVWRSDENAGDIFLRTYDINGSALQGSPISIALNDANAQIDPHVTALGNSHIVASFTNGNEAGGIANLRVYNLDGTTASAVEPLLPGASPLDFLSDTHLVAHGNSSTFTAIYNISQSGLGVSIVARSLLFNAGAGTITTVGSDVVLQGVNTLGNPAIGARVENAEAASLLGASSGKVAIVWTNSFENAGVTNNDTMLQIFNAPAGNALSAVSSLIRVTSLAADEIRHPASVAALSNGNVVVVWSQSDLANSGDLGDVYFSLYDGSGAVVGGLSEILVNQDTAGAQGNDAGNSDDPQLAVAGLDDGGFVVFWIDSAAVSGLDLVGQRYNADGSANGDAFLVNTLTAGTQARPDAAVLEDGRILLSWASSDNGAIQSTTLAFGAGSGADLLDGGAGSDILYGGGGNDILMTGGGTDSLYGGNGDDMLGGDASNSVNSLIDGGGGVNDWFLAGSLNNGSNSVVDLTAGTVNAGIYNGSTVTGIEHVENAVNPLARITIIGSTANNSLIGGNAVDRLEGRDGDDFLLGHDGDDELYGGAGRDIMAGGNGNDYLDAGTGGVGNEILQGNTNNDTLTAANAVNSISFDGGSRAIGCCSTTAFTAAAAAPC